MLHTYKARLNHHQLEWLDAPPELVNLHPVMVFVTFLEEPTLTQTASGPRMAEILQQMADRNALSQIPDPVAWQREIRQDRSLPGREESC